MTIWAQDSVVFGLKYAQNITWRCFLKIHGNLPYNNNHLVKE